MIDHLKTLLKGTIGRTIISFETVDSTNTLALDLGDKDAAHGTVVIADRQTKGRGRLGRRWVSPPGVNIYMSIILRPVMKTQGAALLTFAAAVACCRALREATALPVAIKWPNDLMVKEKKLGGILAEIRSTGERILFAVIGIGINVNSVEEDFPPDVRATATSLRIETAEERPRTALIAAILNETERWYDIFANDGGKEIIKEWRTLASTLGRSVKATTGTETLTGIAEDIDDEGRLLLRLSSGAIKTISAGDLTILR